MGWGSPQQTVHVTRTSAHLTAPLISNRCAFGARRIHKLPCINRHLDMLSARTHLTCTQRRNNGLETRQSCQLVKYSLNNTHAYNIRNVPNCELVSCTCGLWRASSRPLHLHVMSLHMYQCDMRSSERCCHLGDEVGLPGDGIDLHLQNCSSKMPTQPNMWPSMAGIGKDKNLFVHSLLGT